MNAQPPAHSRNNCLFAAALVMELAGGAAIVAIPLLAISLGASEFELGSIGLCQRLPYIVLCLVFGWLSDRIGRKTLATAACVGLIGLYALFACASALWHIFALVPLAAVCISLFWPPVQAWVSELPGRSLGRRTSFFNMAWSVGGTFGCLLGGLLSESSSRLPFTVCLCLSCALLLLILSTPTSRGVPSAQAASQPELFASDKRPLTDTFLYASWVANFAAFASVGSLFYIFPKLAKSLGMSGSIIGALFFVSGCSRTVTFFAMGRSEKWWYKLRGPIVAQMAGALGMAVVGFGATRVHMALAFMLVGYMCGTCYGASLFYCLRSTGKVGRRAGLHEGILVAGSMMGAFVGGICAQHIHPRSPYLLGACVILMAAGVQTWMVWSGRAQQAHRVCP